MSILSFAGPIESALPVAQTVFGALMSVLRPAVGIGAAVMMAFLFRPLFVGVWRTLVIVAKPRLTLEERATRQRQKASIVLNRIANEHSMRQPNLASELRCFASRD